MAASAKGREVSPSGSLCGEGFSLGTSPLLFRGVLLGLRVQVGEGNVPRRVRPGG